MKVIWLYKKGNVSLGPGVRIAKMSLSEFLDILKEYNIEMNPPTFQQPLPRVE